MKMACGSIVRQRGVTLLEMMLVMSFLAIATLMAFENRQADLEQAQARIVGLKINQYNNAVRSMIAKTPNLSAGQKTGSLWLKSTLCGGPLPQGQEFLPCDFPSASAADPIRFGLLNLTTTIATSGSGDTRRITATTVTTPFSIMKFSGLQVRSDLAGVAALTAASATQTGYSVGSSGLTPYAIGTDSSYSSNPSDAVITMVAGNKASDDVWLRTDGGNKMHANLQFDNTDSPGREIVGVSRIQNLAGLALRLGASSGMLPISSASLIVDTNSEILGSLLVRSDLSVNGGASIAGSAVVGGSASIGGNATVAGNVTAANLTATGNVTAGGAVSAQIFYDSNNATFYVDPNNWSNLANLQTQNINNVGALTSAGRITAGEYVDLAGIAYVGNWCPKNGLIASDVNGKTLSCQNGIWKAGGGGSKVLTGFVTNGQQIPIPEGATLSSCTWSSASGTNSHPGSRPDYAGGNYSIVGADRIVTCGFKDKGEVIAGGYCSFVIACDS